MKVIAYTSQDGNEFVTAFEAQRKNLSTFFSAHKPGSRVPMIKVRRGDTHFFRYKSEHGSTGTTAPETLTHTLCKKVLVELANQQTSTKLQFKNQYGPLKSHPDVDITLTEGTAEYPIQANGNRYVIDAFCHFVQTDAQPKSSSLETRWNGRIAFEIFHTHGTPKHKSKDLEKEGIPIIQIATGDKKGALYIDESAIMEMDEQEANQAIANHLDKLRRIFRKSIQGIVYNNPRSDIFIEYEELSNKYSSMQEAAKKAILGLKEDLSNKDTKLNQSQIKIEQYKEKIKEYKQDISHLYQRQERHSLTIDKQKQRIIDLENENKKLQESIDRLPKTFWQKLAACFKK